jgi:hypothetical protein
MLILIKFLNPDPRRLAPRVPYGNSGSEALPADEVPRVPVGNSGFGPPCFFETRGRDYLVPPGYQRVRGRVRGAREPSRVPSGHLGAYPPPLTGRAPKGGSASKTPCFFETRGASPAPGNNLIKIFII